MLAGEIRYGILQISCSFEASKQHAPDFKKADILSNETLVESVVFLSEITDLLPEALIDIQLNLRMYRFITFLGR